MVKNAYRMHKDHMVSGIDSSQSLEEKVPVVPKFAREGMGSYLVWLPC